MDFEEKYLKYKEKYLQLKQFGGANAKLKDGSATAVKLFDVPSRTTAEKVMRYVTHFLDAKDPSIRVISAGPETFNYAILNFASGVDAASAIRLLNTEKINWMVALPDGGAGGAGGAGAPAPLAAPVAAAAGIDLKPDGPPKYMIGTKILVRGNNIFGISAEHPGETDPHLNPSLSVQDHTGHGKTSNGVIAKIFRSGEKNLYHILTEENRYDIKYWLIYVPEKFIFTA